MKIDHVAMYVKDLENKKHFLRNTSVLLQTMATTTRIQISTPTFFHLETAPDWK